MKIIKDATGMVKGLFLLFFIELVGWCITWFLRDGYPTYIDTPLWVVITYNFLVGVFMVVLPFAIITLIIATMRPFVNLLKQNNKNEAV